MLCRSRHLPHPVICLKELLELFIRLADPVLAHSPCLRFFPAQLTKVLAGAALLNVVNVPPNAARAPVHIAFFLEHVWLGTGPRHQHLFTCAR